jgi:threonine/homoserine/homoserine lactone efflux protein
MDRIVALIAFSIVSSVTPGPNNVLLWASGAEFGYRRTLPHVLGTAIGIGSMALGVALGLGALISAIPALAVAMKVAGTIYLLFLAVQIAGLRGAAGGRIAAPLGVGQAAAFQLINPKAWIFAVGAMTTFRPAAMPVLDGSLLVAVAMAIVIVPTASLWAAAGGAINGLIAGEGRQRLVGAALAILVVATVVTVWL